MSVGVAAETVETPKQAGVITNNVPAGPRDDFLSRITSALKVDIPTLSSENIDFTSVKSYSTTSDKILPCDIPFISTFSPLRNCPSTSNNVTVVKPTAACPKTDEVAPVQQSSAVTSVCNLT